MFSFRVYDLSEMESLDDLPKATHGNVSKLKLTPETLCLDHRKQSWDKDASATLES